MLNRRDFLGSAAGLTISPPALRNDGFNFQGTSLVICSLLASD